MRIVSAHLLERRKSLEAREDRALWRQRVQVHALRQVIRESGNVEAPYHDAHG